MANPAGNTAPFDCCGGAHRVTYRDGNREEVLEEEMPEVQVQFQGQRAGSFSVTGPVSKRNYRFSVYARVQSVDERDVEGILSKYRDFTLAGQMATPMSSGARQSPSTASPAAAVGGNQRPAEPFVTATGSNRAAQARQAAQEATRGNTIASQPRTSQVQDRGTSKVNLGGKR